MNKWGRWYLPLCIFTIINYLVWRKSVQVNKAGPIGGEDDDCVKDPSCGADCQVCCQLPYNKDTGKLEVHHYFTGWGLWTKGLTLSTSLLRLCNKCLSYCSWKLFNRGATTEQKMEGRLS